MISARIMVGLGSILGFLAVAMGAFGAHALKDRLHADLLPVYQTAVQYHGIHALALILTGLLASQFPQRDLHWAALAFLLGTIVFSGSLYLLAISGTRWLGAITPFGGLGLLLGWAILAWQMLKP